MNIRGFNLLANADYDSLDVYHFVHLVAYSTAFIPIRISFKKSLVGDCGEFFSLHRHYFESKDDLFAFSKTFKYATFLLS